MKPLYIFIFIFFSSFCIYGQSSEANKKTDTTYFYFRADNKYMYINDKHLPVKKMVRDSVKVYEYNLRKDGNHIFGTPSFTNKNFNSDSLFIARPRQISKKEFRSLKRKIITLKDIKQKGYKTIFFNAIVNKTIFLIERKENGKLTILEVEYFGNNPFDEI